MDRQLWLEAGEKLLFAGGTKDLSFDRDRVALTIVDATDATILIHDLMNRTLAQLLIEMPTTAALPVAPGVMYEDPFLPSRARSSSRARWSAEA